MKPPNEPSEKDNALAKQITAHWRNDYDRCPHHESVRKCECDECLDAALAQAFADVRAEGRAERDKEIAAFLRHEADIQPNAFLKTTHAMLLASVRTLADRIEAFKGEQK